MRNLQPWRGIPWPRLLAEQGWPAPIQVDSGNGFQLLFRIDLPTEDGGLVNQVLAALGARFSGADGDVDQSVHNAARIGRLPCTKNCKTHPTEDRPHRMARVLAMPDAFEVVPPEMLTSLAALAPKPKANSRRNGTSRQVPDQFDEAVQRWNAEHPQTWPTTKSHCPVCESPDGLKASTADESRWCCFSSRHCDLTITRDQGLGVRGNGCFTGDALDVEAANSKRTRGQVLKDEGYLPQRRRKERSEQADGVSPQDPTTASGADREALYFHRVGGDVPLHQLVPQAIQLLAGHAADSLFVHADSLAHVIVETDSEPGSAFRRSRAPRIRTYPAAVLRERLDSVAQWLHERENENGLIKIEERWCPREVVNAVRERGVWPGIRLLVGVTGSPVLRSDLTILDRPGYDAATGLLYAPSRDYPPVPDAPSADDVATALIELRTPFDDFPIVSPSDQAALLAYLLTLAARPAIAGPVPMFAILARVPGTGKTLLVDSATVAMTGYPPDKLMVPGGRSVDADAEWRKRIATLAMESSRAVLIDNVADGSMLDSPALAAALTASDLTERLLGTNRSVHVPHRIVWTISGNNVTVAADLARRSVSIDLDAKVEAPHLRSGFKIGNLLQHVGAEHPRLLAAALTVLRGFAAAGCPQHGGPALGMFEAWDALIRSCVIWATGEDPVATQERLRGQSPETGVLAALLIAWRDAIGSKSVQAVDLLRTQALAPALNEAVPGRDGRDLPSSKSLGHYLRRNTGRVVGGLRIERVGTALGVTLWAVKKGDE